MPKLKSISITLGGTIQTKQYENIKPSVTVEFEKDILDSDDKVYAIARKAAEEQYKLLVKSMKKG